jgi:hypothetical protein
MSKVAEVYEWRGRTVVDRDGEKIGTLDEIWAAVLGDRLDQRAARGDDSRHQRRVPEQR